jgi:hypothetical protein
VSGSVIFRYVFFASIVIVVVDGIAVVIIMSVIFCPVTLPVRLETRSLPLADILLDATGHSCPVFILGNEDA